MIDSATSADLASILGNFSSSLLFYLFLYFSCILLFLLQDTFSFILILLILFINISLHSSRYVNTGQHSGCENAYPGMRWERVMRGSRETEKIRGKDGGAGGEAREKR